jgi:hypothetical protein
MQRARGIVQHVHEADPRTTIFQPIVKTSIQLQQFTILLLLCRAPKDGFQIEHQDLTAKVNELVLAVKDDRHCDFFSALSPKVAIAMLRPARRH